MPAQNAVFTLHRHISEEDAVVLRMGNIPQQMEDKWFWYCEENTLYAHRSWTGICIYILEMNPGMNEHSVTVNRNPHEYKCTDIKEDEKTLNKLLNWWTRPEYDFYNEWLSETLDTLKKQQKPSFDQLSIDGRTVPAIYFHKPEEPFGFLSNWYMSDFELDGLKFNSNEQFIMYSKAKLLGDDETAEKIMEAKTPAEHQLLGQNAHGFNAALWHGIRQAVAVRGLYAKFTQNDDLRQRLLDTEDAYLVECAYHDVNWACGRGLDEDEKTDISQWKGKNLLGFALMTVRDLLRDDENLLSLDL